MRFWDASAVVPLLMEERWTEELRDLLSRDRDIAAWWGTRVEGVSAIRRRERAGEIEARAAAEALALLDQFASGWVDVQPSDAIRPNAERLLAVHPLRAADAFQLAAAAAWRRDLTRSAAFVCLDDRLRDAAAREGFDPVPD
jgi:uncharacterized protein